MKTLILSLMFTLLMVFGVQYLLMMEWERFQGVADMRIASMRQELAAVQMPPEQIDVIVGSMSDMRGIIGSHVRSTSLILWLMSGLTWALVMGALPKNESRAQQAARYQNSAS